MKQKITTIIVIFSAIFALSACQSVQNGTFKPTASVGVGAAVR